MVKFWKNDFRNVKFALELLVGRSVPMWMFVVYYCVMLPIGLLGWLVLKPYWMIKVRIAMKELKELEAE